MYLRTDIEDPPLHVTDADSFLLHGDLAGICLACI